MSGRGPSIDVTVEAVANRAFASALEWPGWARSGKTEDLALAALLAYAPRYGVVAARASEALPVAEDPAAFQVVERTPGNGSTSFGVPGSVTPLDLRPVTSAGAHRLAALVQASWDTLADVVRDAPATLRKGPRGGGRDRDEIVRHVIDAERAYARSIGLRPPPDLPIDALRAQVMEVFRLGTDGSPLPGGTWPLRYAARRVAWHVLDHAWEIEDKAELAG